MRHSILVLFLSILGSFLLYGNTINGDFLLDDYFYLDRPELRSVEHLPKIFIESVLPWHKEAGLFRPFSVFTFSLNFIFFGSSPVSFHIFSILLNGLNVFLVFVVVEKITKNKFVSIFSALFFAVLPIHTEAVSYVKARDELLGTFFVLLSVFIFLKFLDRETNIKLLIFSALFYLLAILSKEFTILLPMFMWYVHSIRKVGLKKQIKTLLFFVPPLLLMLFLRNIALSGVIFGSDDIEFIANPVRYAEPREALLTAFKISYLYLEKLFVPVSLSASYHYNHIKLVSSFWSHGVVFGLLILGVLLFLTLWKKTKFSTLGVGAAFYLIFYIPFSQILFRGGDVMGERWIYLPSVGISLIVSAIVYTLFKRFGKLVLVVVIPLLFFYSFLTIQRNRVWTSQLSVSESMVESAPDSIKGYVVAGYIYAENGDLVRAKQMAYRSIEIYDSYANSWDLLGAIYYNEGKYDEARLAMQKVLTIDPTNANAYTNLARLEYQSGKYDKAESLLTEVVQKTHPYPRAVDVVFLAQTLSKLERWSESNEILDRYEKSITSELFYDYNFIRSVNMYNLGNLEEAEKYFIWDQLLPREEKIEMIKKF